MDIFALGSKLAMASSSPILSLWIDSTMSMRGEDVTKWVGGLTTNFLHISVSLTNCIIENWCGLLKNYVKFLCIVTILFCARCWLK